MCMSMERRGVKRVNRTYCRTKKREGGRGGGGGKRARLV